MKAKELAEFLLQNPELDVVVPGHSDANGMYQDLYDPQKTIVSIIPRDYSWSRCPYAEFIPEPNDYPKKEVIIIG